MFEKIEIKELIDSIDDLASSIASSFNYNKFETIKSDFLSGNTVIKVNELILKPIKKEDKFQIDRIAKNIGNNPKNIQYYAFENEEKKQEWFDGIIKQNSLKNPEEISLAVFLEENPNEMIGVVQFLTNPIANGCGDPGIFLDPSQQGKGYGTKIFTVANLILFSFYNYSKVQATAKPDNKASLRMQEKVGYTYIKTLKPGEDCNYHEEDRIVNELTIKNFIKKNDSFIKGTSIEINNYEINFDIKNGKILINIVDKIKNIYDPYIIEAFDNDQPFLLPSVI